MQEIARIALPNLVSQGDQLARSRGTMAGGELALRTVLAESLRHEGVERAEHLPPAHALEGIDDRERERRGGDGGRRRQREPDEDEQPDDGPGHHIDVTA